METQSRTKASHLSIEALAYLLNSAFLALGAGAAVALSCYLAGA